MKSGYIAIIDDEPDLLEVVQKLLENAGYTVFPFTNPHDAFRRIKQNDLECIITDITLGRGVLSGASLVRMIRDRCIYTPILVYSGTTIKDDIKLLERLQYVKVIDKPTTDIVKTVKDFIENYHTRSQLTSILDAVLGNKQSINRLQELLDKYQTKVEEISEFLESGAVKPERIWAGLKNMPVYIKTLVIGLSSSLLALMVMISQWGWKVVVDVTKVVPKIEVLEKDVKRAELERRDLKERMKK